MITKKISLSFISLLLYSGFIQAQDTSNSVFINELQINTSGLDWEFIELQGIPGTDLSSFSILSIESDSGNSAGTIDQVISLNGQSIPEDGFWVAMSPAAASEYGVTGDMTIDNNSFENSTTSFLLVSDFTGLINDDLDNDNDGVLDITPWNSILDSITLKDNGANDVAYSNTVLGPSGNFLPSGAFRNPDAPNGNFSTTFLNFALSDGTPGKSNTGTPTDPSTPIGTIPITAIHNIQGNGSSSPMENKVVTIEGIVVGDFQENTVNGFYVQEEDTDADTNENTSEGIFIFSRNSDVKVSVGDKVKVIGKVSEFFEQTQLNEISSIEILGKSDALPTITTVKLPVASPTFLERYEGMYVSFTQDLFVTNTFLLGRGNELTLSSGSFLLQPTQIAFPGIEATKQLEANQLNQIIIDDANRSNNLSPVIFPAPQLTFDNEIRAGYKTSDVKGILTYNDAGFELGGNSTAAYRVYVTEIPNFNSATNPRTSKPSDVGGSLKVASFNVLNYFNGDGLGGGFPSSRGADTPANFKRQRDKIISAIAAIDADIVGLIEIENDGYGNESAIQDLVNGLNDKIGSNDYSIVNPGVAQIGTDEITTGFIYKNTTVSLQGAAAILDASINPKFNDRKNRPSLAQTFKELATDGLVTISVNHLKSKGSNCDAEGDPNTGDGQGNCNLTRKAAAQAIADWLATDPTSSGSDNFVIIGDLNAYAKEDPIVALENAGYTNLVSTTFGNERHGYQFGSQFGTLDYAMANDALLPNITGADIWNINADEPVSFDYTTRFKSEDQLTSFYSDSPFRSSDHDPVIFGLDLSDNTLSTPKNTASNIANVRLFPNPMSSELNIVSNTFSGPTEIHMYNLAGKKLLSQSVDFKNTTTNQLNVSELASGVYLLLITNTTQSHYQLITKQ
ncbi:ExeM/NucH family extracellular endonuclease [Aquimarina agarilytica]|uniref:ExeM/NucH family extracellular endonuclease n=1 Tax=Aquimarina agarilytica TaxID=1087449 RepID=UPI000289D3DD|nr:ExeM/NucH family extracellular endonuclease [Aquimarina agarilytica]